MQKSFVFLSMLAFSAGCDEKKPKKASPESQCSLSFDDVSDSIWVMLDHEKNEEPNSRQRIKFYKDGETLKVKYPASNDYMRILDYECKIDEAGTTMNCHTEPKIDEVCIALIAGDKKCVKKPMQNFYSKFSNEEIDKARDEMKKKVRQAKRNGSWPVLKKRYNSLAKHLMDVLSVRIDKTECNLSVTDNYQTIFNGEVSENANPVGTSNFDKWDKVKLMWDSCTDDSLITTTESTYPKALDRTRSYPVGTTLHYWYWSHAGNKAWAVPTEGCNYKYDLYYNHELTKEGLVPEVQTVEKPKKGEPKSRLIYHVDKTYNEVSNKTYPNVFAMDITKTCGDKTEKHITCSAVHIVKKEKQKEADKSKGKGKSKK